MGTAPGRPGFSMLELIVVIAIVGLLASLIIPAVQQARVSSRRSVCINNLHQFGLAMANHAEAHGGFPTSDKPLAAYWRMLPYLDQTSLYERLSRRDFPDSFNVAVFNCPSDGRMNAVIGEANYFFNDGTTYRDHYPLNGIRIRERGGRTRDLRPADITDGFSQTAAISERLANRPLGTSHDEMANEPRRYYWFTERRYSHAGEEPLANEQCRNHRTTTFPQWFGLFTNALQLGAGYDHRLPPNHPACYNGPEDMHMNAAQAASPASSNHPGGVNVLMADGSVRFAGESVDQAVWQSVGTRNGGESGQLPF